MSEQKAFVVPSASIPHTLISKPIPVPGPDEVLVKIEGIGLNPAEWKLELYPPFLEAFKFPFYSGTDGAGVVEVVGKNVSHLKKGDRVFFQGWFKPDYGTYQQYALAPSKLVSKIPSTMSSLEAASLPMAAITAAFAFCLPNSPVPSLATTVSPDVDYSLVTHGRNGAGIKPFWEEGAKGLKEGEPIVILGGSSSVGQLVIQVAAHYGFSPIIATSSTKHTAYLKSLGATHIVDRNASDPIEAIKKILENQSKPLGYVFDAVEAVTQAYIDLLAAGGSLMIANPLPPNLQLAEGKKQIFVAGYGHVWNDYLERFCGALGGLLESGVIKPNRIEKLPGGLAGISGGLERLKKGEVSGVKLVVDPTETP